ncbi:MAG TPA: maltose alpha-D-glucosyltransferase [Steroidobacteraceae bacterium]|nr:maltose alpha-D-glucosyltransferase [Steroidobacteraceae bacterium]
MGTQRKEPVTPADPLWFKDAIIYEVHVRAFFDANDDGVGDFPGLTRKLEYIQDLGVNTIWLLPFYPSPGRDDGYDIADYHSIHPQYGSRAQFRAFVREAHRRNLRVITELVLNHTSDAHPWFQAARRAPPGSAKRDWYVWSDTPQRYAGTRVIFRDTETSNWAWDPLARAYYWHRFFSHQPDLNFDNPQVLRAMLRVMDFWLRLGVDGFRLDAVPYLVEREGTINENLRETHEIIRVIRRAISSHYPGRMLLAEANQWPEDVRDYFGDGRDECQMAYHFPLMPRMYMAIAQEDRHPIVEIMEQTPDIPDTCQWAIFLRNHDELTLEMVTSRERDYMYQAYAADARARLNLGIRRRLAPLLDNDPERIKLMNSLLLSMPGAPIIYYGDEIGMGDNVFLGDRNGLRTPMQWSPDRNAGFSRADPQQLYLPPIMDPVYGFEAVNVEAQSRDRSSLLNWMRRMLQVRRSTQAFGRGTLRFIRPGNRRVLVYLRQYEADTILCVANLARSAQPVELDLADHRGAVPIELLGRAAFPPVGELPYLLTLPGYAFYWFRLSREAEAPPWHDERAAREDVPVLVLIEGWSSFFPERVAPWRSNLASALRAQLEGRVLPGYLAPQRWAAPAGVAPVTDPAARGAGAAGAVLTDWCLPQPDLERWLLGIFEVRSGAQAGEYFVPLTIALEDADEARYRRLLPAALARVRQHAATGVLADAAADEDFCRMVIDAIGAGRELATRLGRMRCESTSAFAELRAVHPGELPLVPAGPQGANTTVRIGDAFFLKIFRRLHAGAEPAIDLARYLTETAHFPNTPPLAGVIEYQRSDAAPATLAMLEGFVSNQGDGWDYTVNHLVRFLEERVTQPGRPADDHGLYMALVRTLATRIAQLHGVLARASEPTLAAEPLTAADLEAWSRAAQGELTAALKLLAERAPHLPTEAAASAATVLAAHAALLRGVAVRYASTPQALKIRCHGDFHLRQVLLRRNDVVITDVGAAGQSVAAQRQRCSPLADIARMLRSFAYARRMALQQCSLIAPDDRQRWEPQLDAWQQQTRSAFLDTYDEAARGSGLYTSLAEVMPLLRLFELEGACADLQRRLLGRPDWVGVPLRILATLAG